jgi:hypothetical protein
MRRVGLSLTAILLAGVTLLQGCDKSRQTADGSTRQGDSGTAGSVGNGGVGSTGSPEQGGANGSGPSSVPPGATINQLDRNTPDAQSPGQANAARSP